MSNAETLGKFVWHELLTTDTAAAAAFYPRVVPWRTQPSSMPGYTLWLAGQTQVGGLMALPPDAAGSPPHWLVYVGTPSVDSSCGQAQGLGAKVLKSPADIPNVGRFAVLSDPQGATFALFTPGAGAPPPGPKPAQGGFSWHELATTDVAGALRFYGELFGWRKGRSHDMGAMGVYQIFEHGGEGVGGMCRPGAPNTPPSWLSYVNVADANRAVTAAKGAGGGLLHGPVEVPGGSWIGLLLDPQGGAFAVQEAPRTMSQPRPAPPVVKPAATPAAPAAAKPAAPKPARTAAKKKPAKKSARKPARKAKKSPKRRPARKASRRPAKKRTAKRSARRSRRR